MVESGIRASRSSFFRCWSVKGGVSSSLARTRFYCGEDSDFLFDILSVNDALSTRDVAWWSSNTWAADSNETRCFRWLIRFLTSSQATSTVNTNLYHASTSPRIRVVDGIDEGIMSRSTAGCSHASCAAWCLLLWLASGVRELLSDAFRVVR